MILFVFVNFNSFIRTPCLDERSLVVVIAAVNPRAPNNHPRREIIIAFFILTRIHCL